RFNPPRIWRPPRSRRTGPAAGRVRPTWAAAPWPPAAPRSPSAMRSGPCRRAATQSLSQSPCPTSRSSLLDRGVRDNHVDHLGRFPLSAKCTRLTNSAAGDGDQHGRMGAGAMVTSTYHDIEEVFVRVRRAAGDPLLWIGRTFEDLARDVDVMNPADQ